MKKIFSTVLAVLTAVSILCASFGFFAAAQEPLKYVLLGDSIAAGTGLVSNKQSYGAIVADANGYDFSNYAIAGHTTFNLAQRLEEPEVTQAVSDADIIGISIGGNNFMRENLIELIFNAAVLEDYAKLDAIAVEFYDSFSGIMASIKGMNPDALIVLQTMYNPRNDFLRDTYQKACDRINAALEKYLEENPDSFVLVDVASVIDGKADRVNYDTIHPNKFGHYAIAELMISALNDLGYGTASEPNADAVPEAVSPFEVVITILSVIFGSIQAAIGLL